MQCLGLVGVDLLIREHDLRARGEKRTEFLSSPAGTARSLGERSENGPLGLRAFHDHRVVDVERVEVLALLLRKSARLRNRLASTTTRENSSSDHLCEIVPVKRPSVLESSRPQCHG